jgi:methylmalonyl-CoA/ethylmalonyl-CoA epimerase
MRERNVAFEDEPHVIARMADHDLWMCFFRDLDDNVFALMAEVSKN